MLKPKRNKDRPHFCNSAGILFHTKLTKEEIAKQHFIMTYCYRWPAIVTIFKTSLW